MAAKKEIDTVSGTETTGHDWDGIKELNTPLPRWWLVIFYGCIAWAAFYWVLMPAWPTLTGYTHGVLGYSQRGAVATALDKLKTQRTAEAAGLDKASLQQIVATPKLLEFALAEGKSVFGDNCAPCHGAGAQGARGYPNLNDDDWLWGGTLSDIQHTITVGVRSTSPDTRQSQMPAFGRDRILKLGEISDLTEYVLHLSHRATDTRAVARAVKLYADNCAPCHGSDGKGTSILGAPNLTDAVWLYGSTRADIRSQIENGRSGVMPSWGGRLQPEAIKSLAVYVHSLGGGE